MLMCLAYEQGLPPSGPNRQREQRHNCNTDVSNVRYTLPCGLLLLPPFGHMHRQM